MGDKINVVVGEYVTRDGDRVKVRHESLTFKLCHAHGILYRYRLDKCPVCALEDKLRVLNGDIP